MISSDGTVHRILVSSGTAPGGVTGTAVRHQIQGATGAKQTITVPGTEDATVERSPALAVDRTDGSLASPGSARSPVRPTSGSHGG